MNMNSLFVEVVETFLLLLYSFKLNTPSPLVFVLLNFSKLAADQFTFSRDLKLVHFFIDSFLVNFL